MSLAQAILDQKAAPGRAVAPGVRAVIPDFLLGDRESARLPFGRFAARGGARVAIETVLARDLATASGWGAGGPAREEFLALAAALGAWLAPAGAGERGAIALATLAAPGRLIATLDPAPEAGALGALAVPVGALEAVSLLAGDPLEVEPGPARRIELTGTLPARCDGHDVAGALVAAHPRGFASAWVEVAGEGLSSLAIADRVAIARALVAAGAAAVLFPCDDRARDWMRARGRETDWRRTDAGPAPAGAWSHALEWTVPHAISARTPTRAVPLAWWNGVPVASVEVGPGSPLESLGLFAERLGGRTAAAAVRVSAWSAREAAAPEAGPLAEAVERAGARWTREGDLAPWKRRPGALRLGAGLARGPEAPNGDDWIVGIPAAAEAAAEGRVADPRSPVPSEEPGLAALSPVAPPVHRAVRAATAPGVARSGGERAAADGIEDLRGAVLGRIEADLEAGTLLPMGPRLSEWIADPVKLAPHAVPAARRHAAAPAPARGAWLLVLGEVRDLDGREAGLLALRALGVRAMLAAGVEPRSRALCARAGILALRALRADDLEAVEAGDELELVGGIETWAPDRARVVRDLTRGFALVALPEQGAREWAWARAAAAPPAGSLAC